MYKLAFTYLVKQDRKTWNDLEISLKLLYQNILSKLNCTYKVIIFCEGEPINGVKNQIDFLIKKKNINVSLEEIKLSKYVKRKPKDTYIKDFPHAADCKAITSLGYRDMCKFFAFDVFFDVIFEDAEYFVRIDTDSFFIYTNKNFIRNLENFHSEYGYISKTIQEEDKAVSLGFGKCLYKFCKKNNKDFEYENYLKLCQEATLKPKIFYTNFEIVKINWAKSNNHKRIMSAIIKSKGIYNFRWGDALIRYYVVHLLKAKKKEMKGCLYKHSGIYDSRNLFTILLTKSYSKIRGRLYKNSYEKRLSRLDKLFLSL